MGMPISILMAEDDAEDRMLVQEAWRESRICNELRFVKDGEDLLDCLLHRGQYADAPSAAPPDLILLDLNMPRMDGREALQEIKSHAALRQIPVIVLTSSKAEEDVLRSYDLGVNSYITKPVTFAKLVDVLKTFGKYWFEIVTLPRRAANTG